MRPTPSLRAEDPTLPPLVLPPHPELQLCHPLCTAHGSAPADGVENKQFSLRLQQVMGITLQLKILHCDVAREKVLLLLLQGLSTATNGIAVWYSVAIIIYVINRIIARVSTELDYRKSWNDC